MSRRLVVEADGGSRGNPGPAGYGAVVRDADTGEVLREVAAGIGVATNNVAEYRGLIAGLAAAVEEQPAEVEVRMDSKLVVEQMSGRWRVKHPDMRPLATEAAALVRLLPRVEFHHVPRLRNAHADRLANEAMDAAAAGREWTPGTAASRRPGRNRLSGWMAPTHPPTVTWLLRHAETALTTDRRFSGRGPAELTPYGERQAQAAAERLAGVADLAAVVTSPLPRASRTAQIVADRLGVPVTADEGLAETDFGDWEGHTFAEVREKWPAELDAWLADPSVAPPGGESFAATAQRVTRAREGILERHPDATIVLVSHVTPIKLLVREALGAPVQALFRLHLDPAAVSVVDWFPDGPAVLRLWNDSEHVARLPRDA